MKRWTVMLATALGLCLATALPAAQFYVSPDGSDDNPGTKSKPFRTLEAARDALRATNQELGHTVYLMGGRYFRDHTFELDERDSGSEGAPVVFKPVEDAEVFIDGGKTIPADAIEPVTDQAVRERLAPDARDQVRRIDLKAYGVDDYGELGPRGFRRAYKPAPLELFIDGHSQTIAQWPNPGEPHIQMGEVVEPGSTPRDGDYSMKPGEFKYVVDRAERWTKASDLYISGIFHFSWADDTIKVAKIDTEKGTIRTTLPHIYNFRNASYTKWYALNLIEEIDIPGEYCVDQDTGILYFYPPKDMSEEPLLQVSLMEKPMVAMEGASFIRFENLTFENSRGTGFYIERGTSNEIVGCTLRNLGILGVQFGKGTKPFPYGKQDGCGYQASGEPGEPASRMMGNWHEQIYRFTAWNREAGTNHGLLSCDIHDIGAGGVSLSGGDRKTLTPGGNFVKNCDIYRVNRLDRTYKSPINVDGVGNIMTNNHLHDTESNALYLHGNDHVFAYNEVDGVCRDISDMGSIYMGRDPSESGNIFRYNFFHDISSHHEGGAGVQAIFFDDCCIFGATVYGNVFYKTGNTGVIKFNGGGLSPIINNIVVDSPSLIQGGGPTSRVVNWMKGGGINHDRLFEAVDILKPPYVTKYPILKEVYEGRQEVTTPNALNYIVSKDYSQFVDAENLNFQLKKDSKVYDELNGFEPIPFDKIGLHEDEYRSE